MTDDGETADPRQTKVFVVDDDAGVRESLAALLSAGAYAYELFSCGEEFLERIDDEDEGCVLLDYSLGGMNGIEVLKALRAAGLYIPVIIITAHGQINLAVEAMRADATDFIEKPWDRTLFFEAIDKAIKRHHDAQVLIRARKAAMDVIGSFTPREKEVFDHLIEGASNKLVARALDISPRTVEFYRAKVLEKAGVLSVAELVRLAFLAQQFKV